jgi:hypothetical protein
MYLGQLSHRVKNVKRPKSFFDVPFAQITFKPGLLVPVQGTANNV